MNKVPHYTDDNFRVVLEGQLVQVDADLLVTSLVHTTAMLRELCIIQQAHQYIIPLSAGIQYNQYIDSLPGKPRILNT